MGWGYNVDTMFEFEVPREGKPIQGGGGDKIPLIYPSNNPQLAQIDIVPNWYPAIIMVASVRCSLVCMVCMHELVQHATLHGALG